MRKAGIMCPHHLVVEGEIPAAAAAGGVLSTFYVRFRTRDKFEGHLEKNHVPQLIRGVVENRILLGFTVLP